MGAQRRRNGGIAMRPKVSEILERGRITSGPSASDRSYGANGAFHIGGLCGEKLMIVASDGRDPESQGWEHVSVSTRRRVPNWQEMCFVKDLFWDDEETVFQFHPPGSAYANNHPAYAHNHRFCLHLWKSPHVLYMPPPILIGVKDLAELRLVRAR